MPNSYENKLGVPHVINCFCEVCINRRADQKAALAQIVDTLASPKVKCNHEQFESNVTVNRLEDSDTFSADVHIICTQCRQQAQFVGPNIGLMPDRPTVNPDGTELRIPLRFDGLANPMFPGFTCKGAAS